MNLSDDGVTLPTCLAFSAGLWPIAFAKAAAGIDRVTAEAGGEPLSGAILWPASTRAAASAAKFAGRAPVV